MAQPNFPAIGNHLQVIQGGLQGIENEVALVANMPALLGYNAVQHRIDEMQQPVFAAVRGPRRARRGDCQEPGTGRDGKT